MASPNSSTSGSNPYIQGPLKSHRHLKCIHKFTFFLDPSPQVCCSELSTPMNDQPPTSSPKPEPWGTCISSHLCKHNQSLSSSLLLSYSPFRTSLVIALVLAPISLCVCYNSLCPGSLAPHQPGSDEHKTWIWEHWNGPTVSKPSGCVHIPRQAIEDFSFSDTVHVSQAHHSLFCPWTLCSGLAKLFSFLIFSHCLHCLGCLLANLFLDTYASFLLGLLGHFPGLSTPSVIAMKCLSFLPFMMSYWTPVPCWDLGIHRCPHRAWDLVRRKEIDR